MQKINRVIYYSHSMCKYNTTWEREELKVIKKMFPTASIINPNGYLDKYLTPKERMEQSLEIIKTKINGMIFSEFDGHIGKGVFEELKTALEMRIPTALLRNGMLIKNFKVKINDKDDWRINYAIIEVVLQ